MIINAVTSFLRTYICQEVTIYIHILVYNIKTTWVQSDLYECLIILEPIFKLNSYDALAVIWEKLVLTRNGVSPYIYTSYLLVIWNTYYLPKK